MKSSKLWEEGRYVDLWSVPHLLAGVILAGIFYYLEFNLLWNFITSFLVMVLWEIFEFAFNIKEHMTNKVMDVVIGIMGFFLMYPFLIYFGLKIMPYLIILGAIYAILNAWGFYAYYTRKNNKNL